MSERAFTREDLRPVNLFDDLDDDELDRWVAVAHEMSAEAGDVLADVDAPPPGVMLLLEGRVRTWLVEEGSGEPMGRMDAPTWIGAISVITGAQLMRVRLQAEAACRIALIKPADFRELMFSHQPVHDRVMAAVTPVISRVAAVEQHRERLAALGTMAAGLTHELNNPAAAASRAAAELAETVEIISSTMARFVESGIDRGEAEKLIALQEQAVARSAEASELDTLDAADAEDVMLAHLEALSIPEPWRIAEPLAAAGLDEEWLARLGELAGPATDAALRWVAATLTASRLATELKDSTERISALVGAVKSYASMGHGELVEVNVHKGLKTTLIVLGHKLKHTSIEVVHDYDRELPPIIAHGPELNQVWTNLLDNAIDALGEDGTITITTRRDGDCAVIAVTDNGPGIPSDIAAHIFDPFFTTKDVGHGTGLGLATARRIVVERHGGSLIVESEPGRTTFEVRLPFKAAHVSEPATG